MKNIFLLVLSFCFYFTQGQTKKVLLTSLSGNTEVKTSSTGVLQVNVAPIAIIKFKTRGIVYYSDFGAIGDGKTDAIDAIAATHAFANKHALKVKANDGATYYISGKERTAVIQTDTDFGSAKFLLDDTNVANRSTSVFIIKSSLKPILINGITSLKKKQNKIKVSLPSDAIITVTNSGVKHYIRYGRNQNKGAAQTDIFVVDKNGNVDKDTPIIWDFKQITTISALPLDQKNLKITGGKFTTIANKAESKYTYYARNILINRSNVIVDGLEHRIIGEANQGAPYHGFINTRDCANVTIKNTTVTGHKTYKTIGSAGKIVSMGSYDISINRSLNVLFLNCTQLNDINDKAYWGVFSSNYSKNLVFDNCSFSRFDAHKGVANATIRNSTLGHMGINAIGCGVLKIENSTIRGKSLVNFRSDYGSSWQGVVIIRNCVFVPAGGKTTSACIFNGYNSGLHDFGYTCYMPKRIIIENLKIDDSNHPEDKEGASIFEDFNEKMVNDSFIEKFPYVITKKVILKNITTTSGKKLKISSNGYMFKNVKIRAK